MKHLFATATAAAALLLAGCSDQDDAAVTTDMHEDFDHDHKHQHSDGDDHEHDHADGFKGTHSHGHSHSHRHGDPIHGGKIVSVGHTHHKGGATHYHAEIMPIEESSIRFFVLTESDDGVSKDYPIEDGEITALISLKGKEAAASNVNFLSVSEGKSAEFVLSIPDDMTDGDAYSVVVPKIKLGGQRLNFSFTASRKNEEESADD